MSAEANKEIVYEPRGQITELFKWMIEGKAPTREVLVEGPAGTGKSRGHGEWLYHCMDRYPGSRHLVVRKTRKSLTDSWMVTWEEKVLYPGHPMLDGPKSTNRHQYEHPNGSTLVMGGLDEPTKYYSSEWDTVSYEEAIQSDLDEWEKFKRSLRYGKMPFQMLLGLVNPGPEGHFLNQRCIGPQAKMRRIVTRHVDNPSLPQEYLDDLRELTGVRYRNLFLGEWCTAEGIIFAEWDTAKHMIYRKDVPFHPAIHGPDQNRAVRIRAFYGAVDWGLRAPGVFGVWAVDDENNVYLVAEVYKTEKPITYWANLAVKLDKIYKFDRIFCDPENAAMIDLFNAVIGDWRNRDGESVAVKAKNSWHAGIEAVRERLVGHAGTPSLYVCRDALYDGRDERLARKFKPYCLEMEIPAYTYKLDIDGKPVNERNRDAEEPTCAAHSIDQMRYLCLSIAGHDERIKKIKPAFEPGTWAEWARHDEVLDLGDEPRIGARAA